MEPFREGRSAPQVVRASDQERDIAVGRLKDAFAEGRLTDGEFDERMRSALAARTRSDLDELFTDLPAPSAQALARPVGGGSVAAPVPGRFALAYKNSMRYAGRWRVPETFRAVVYKGSGTIDLRTAELTSGVTTIVAVAYKSNIEVLVPPGVRVEVSGVGASRAVDGDLDAGPSADAPVVHVRALAYKGMVETRSAPRR